MLNNTSTVYFVSIGVSFALVIWSMVTRNRNMEQKNSKEQDISQGTTKEVEDEQNSFEISATDECQFVPLVSEEEDRRIAEQLAPKTKYMELDSNNPGVRFCQE